MDQLSCVACIVEAKLGGKNMQAAMYGTPAEPPTVRPAVAILNGQTICEEHIVIQQQSQLAAPNGSPLLLGR